MNKPVSVHPHSTHSACEECEHSLLCVSGAIPEDTAIRECPECERLYLTLPGVLSGEGVPLFATTQLIYVHPQCPRDVYVDTKWPDEPCDECLHAHIADGVDP